MIITSSILLLNDLLNKLECFQTCLNILLLFITKKLTLFIQPEDKSIWRIFCEQVVDQWHYICLDL